MVAESRLRLPDRSHNPQRRGSPRRPRRGATWCAHPLFILGSLGRPGAGRPQSCLRLSWTGRSRGGRSRAVRRRLHELPRVPPGGRALGDAARRKPHVRRLRPPESPARPRGRADRRPPATLRPWSARPSQGSSFLLHFDGGSPRSRLVPRDLLGRNSAGCPRSGPRPSLTSPTSSGVMTAPARPRDIRLPIRRRRPPFPRPSRPRLGTDRGEAPGPRGAAHPLRLLQGPGAGPDPGRRPLAIAAPPPSPQRTRRDPRGPR